MRLTRRRALGTFLGTFLGATGLLAAGTAGAVEWLKAPTPVPRPAPAAPGAPALPSLPNAPSGVTGWMAVDLDTGAVIDAHNADHAFAPASVAKLPTTFYALERLGPEHRFRTRLLATGPVEDGVLQGDLVLAGGADPELDTDALAPLVAALKVRGITSVTGRLVADGSAGLQVPAIDPTQPVEAAYNPSLSGLNLNFNRVWLKWGGEGEGPALRLSARALRHDPEVGGIRAAISGDSGEPLFSHDVKGGSEFWQIHEIGVRGKGGRWLPVRRPAHYAGEALAALAERAELSAGAVITGEAPAGARQLAEVESRPLREIIASMLQHSTNLTAELVGQAAARAIGAEPASLAGSARVMNAWAATTAGFAAGDPGFRLTNHSGLAVDSRVSPRRLVELLVAVAGRQPGKGERYKKLPGGPIDLLRSYNVAAESVDIDYDRLEIAAKTGTMDYIRGLAGYVATPSGRRLAFAVFSNDLERRTGGVRQIDKGWMARARIFERALIRRWVVRLEG